MESLFKIIMYYIKYCEVDIEYLSTSSFYLPLNFIFFEKERGII